MQPGYLRIFSMQKNLDHLFSFALVILLTVLAIQGYRLVNQRAEVCARIASQNDLRLDIHYHHALTGDWPENFEQLLRTRPSPIPYQAFAGDEVALENGAIRIRATRGGIRGETLSLRPAVWSEHATGPATWVVGGGGAAGAREIQGRDETTLGPHLILNAMQ